MTQTDIFAQMNLSEGMKHSINSMGFVAATPIQSKTIPLLLEGRDILGQAQTGTGKTAAFGIPLIERIDENNKEIQGLVVCPTRELCIQVASELSKLANHKPAIKICSIYGGQGFEIQLNFLKRNNPQIIVATPGRLFDHLRRKTLKLSHIKMLVLDEADEMLDMGFREEIEQIFALAPQGCQRLFFSATMPKAISDLAKSFLKSPSVVKFEATSITGSGIEQKAIPLESREKTAVLGRLLEYHNPKLAVVFCNAKKAVDELVEKLEGIGFNAGALHGDLTQAARDKVMGQFRKSQIRVLVATDVAARGIDVDDVEMVVNFHLPQDPEDYVHRIGRTGRAGRKGIALSLIDPRDRFKLKDISRFAKVNISENKAPSLEEVKKVKIRNFFSDLTTIVKSSKLDGYKNIIKDSNIDLGDMAAALMSKVFNPHVKEPEPDREEFAASERGKRRSKGTKDRSTDDRRRGSRDRDRNFRSKDGRSSKRSFKSKSSR